jgi:hypothetical protein
VQAAKIIGFLNTDEALPAEYGHGTTSGALIDAPKIRPVSSPREAILSTDARTNIQKILVLGAYLARRDNSDEFAAAELKTLFVKAGEPAPRNLGRDIRDAVRAGYIMESVSSTDMYAVTNTGHKTLEDGFGTSTAKKARKKSTTKSSKKTEMPEWLRTASVDDQLEGFPSYRQITTRSNRALWVLQWATNAGRERMTGTEISAVADKLSDHIPAKQVAACFSQHLSNNRVSKTTEGYKVLYSGSEFLKALAGEES